MSLCSSMRSSVVDADFQVEMLFFGSPGSTKSQTRDLNFKLSARKISRSCYKSLCCITSPFPVPMVRNRRHHGNTSCFFCAKNFRTLGFLGSFRFFKRSDPYNLWNTKSWGWIEDDVPSRCLGDFWGDTSRLIFQGL